MLNIYQAVTGMERDAILAEVGDLSWGGFKPRLADAVVAHLEPIQLKYAEVSADKAYLSGVLKSGVERADDRARELNAAKAAMGSRRGSNICNRVLVAAMAGDAENPA